MRLTRVRSPSGNSAADRASAAAIPRWAALLPERVGGGGAMQCEGIPVDSGTLLPRPMVLRDRNPVRDQFTRIRSQPAAQMQRQSHHQCRCLAEFSEVAESAE